MDPDSPVARVERTFWTVWYYITGAVNRFFRPEPTDITEPNSIQESTVDSEPANTGHAEGEASRRVVDEEQPVATAPLLSSSPPLVAWELGTTDIDLGPPEESAQDKTQLGRGSESEGEGKREEQVAQTGHDDEALLDAKEDKQEENGDQQLSTGRQDGMQENREYEEQANMGSPRLTEDATSEDVEESKRKADAEEETERALTPEDPQKMGETMTNIQVQEEDEEMQHDGDYEETQGALPEEVESKEPASLQNSSCSPEADYLLVREHMEEEQESTQDIKDSFDAGLPQGTEKLPVEAVIQGSEHLFEEEEGELVLDSIKTTVEDSEKEFESDFGLKEETDKVLNKPQDGTEELLVTFETDEVLCDARVVDAAGEEVVGFAGETFLEAGVQKMTEKNWFQQSVDDIISEQPDSMTLSLLEDCTEAGFLQQSDETEPKLLDVEESAQDDTQPGRGSESEGEGKREGQVTQTGHDDEVLLDANEDKQEENGDQKLSTGGQDGMQENREYEEQAKKEESKRKADAEEETERALTPEDPQKMGESMTNIQVEEEDDEMQHEDEDLEAEDTEGKLCQITNLSLEDKDNKLMEVENSDGVQQLASENEPDERAKQIGDQPSVCEELSDDSRDVKEDPGLTSLNVELQMADDKSGIVSEDALIFVEQEHVMAHRSESDEVEDVKEEGDESMLDEGAVIEEEPVNEASNNQTIDESLKEETLTEDGQEDILTEHISCSEEVVQNAETELYTAADGEQGGVAKDTEVQTKTREADDDVTESHSTVIREESDVTHISVDERFYHEGQVEKERLSSEEGNKESYMEKACTSVTVKPEGETEQEMSGGFKNIPPGVCEGRAVVLQELNSPTCEETQEGVPEYNNEPDENTTQRFLEDGDYEEIQGALPEEVESKEPASLQNSSCSPETDYLLVREHMEEEQESTQDIKDGFDAGLPQGTEKVPVEAVIKGSEHLFEEEEGGLVLDSMKTTIEDSEKEFESDFGLKEETDKVPNEPQDGTEELLVTFETDEVLCDARVVDAAGEEVVGFAGETFLEAGVQKMTEKNWFQQSVDDIISEQPDSMTLSLLEDFTEAGFLQQSDETEPKLLDVEMQDAEIDMEETGYGVEEEAAEEEMQIKNEMEILHLQVAGMAESELSGPVESLETENQLSAEVLKISNEEMVSKAEDEAKTDESKPNDLTLLSTEEMVKHATESEWSNEETVCSIGAHRDVIDEEILDFWIETSLSEDTDGIKHPEGPEPGQQTGPSSEEQDEISAVHTEKDKDQLVESTSREFISDTETSSSTVESGFLDQSLSEWGAQNSETQLLKSTSTGSFQGIYDMLANMSESADISELSTQQSHSESLDVLLEEAAEAGQSILKEEESITETRFHPDSGVTSPESRHLDLDILQEETDEEIAESVETESGSQKEIDADWNDTEEEEAKSLTEKSTLSDVEQTKAEAEPFQITISDYPDEIKDTDSGRSTSGSEASIEEEILCSQDDTRTEPERKFPSPDEPLPGWSDSTDESLTGLNRKEVAKQPVTKSEEQMEVDSFMLDFTVQRSRIAVKNPRVRPPKDPRSLLHMPSLDPTPSPHLSAKVPAGVPLGGLGIGIKLPGLGAGFPVLKKTKPRVTDENSPDTVSQETVPEEKSEAPKQDEAPHKPKWMPPRHPGFGNPLMSELKNKLKKTTKD